MNANMAFWTRVAKTDPHHVKPITGKQYSGNSPKPYYIVQRLTEEFGMCGLGWGFTILSERMERLSDTDILHIAHVRLWFVVGGQRGEFDQMGQTKACYMTSKGSLLVDEDAPKKSVTDALVKCASYLGFAGDIFSGRWDDSKYVAELKREFDKPPPTSLEPLLQASIDAEKRKKTGAMADTLRYMPPLDESDALYYKELAENVETLFASKGAAIAFDRIEGEGLDNEQKIYLWDLLGSKVRTALKVERGLRIGAT